jgi:ribosome-associated protein
MDFCQVHALTKMIPFGFSASLPQKSAMLLFVLFLIREGSHMTTVVITTEFIKLQDLLKFENLVETGGIAKQIIQDGEVLVNGEVCTMRGKKIRPGDLVTFNGRTYTVAYET